MPEKRLELHEKLCSLLGSRHVYFQPPANVKIKYPCFIYHRNAADEQYANNRRYKFKQRYQLTYITKDADDPIPRLVGEAFENCRYGSDYTTDNLYHSNFDLYY